MMGLVHRYAHVPLGGVILLLIVVVIAWLLERRVDGVWDPALRIAVRVPTAVTIAPGSSEPRPPAVQPETPAEPPAHTAEAPTVATVPDKPAPTAVIASDPPVRYTLESGPFTASATADRLEDQLNRLGYATVRFRRQKVMHLYVVVATGFDSAKDARRAAAELGGGTVVDADGVAEVLLDRVPSLGEAIAAARPVRTRGFGVRIDEGVGPAVIYHIRYGQFESPAEAEARSEALALLGVQSRVVKIK